MDPALLNWVTDTAGVVGGLAIVALIFVWREWRKEAQQKDELYERQLQRETEILGDYHDFAHVLERLSEAYEGRATREDVARDGREA